MANDEKDGYYCSICGGIPPDKVKTRKVMIDGKETGIDHLDFIFENVQKEGIADEVALAGTILAGVREFNYVPTKKAALYAEALLKEYRKWEKEHGA
jgi:hypothetical protein